MFYFLQSLLSDAWILIKVSNHHSSYCQTRYSCQAFLLKISCLVHNIRFKYFFVACRYFVLLSRIITKAIIFLDNVLSDLYPNVHSVHVGPVWNCLVVILRSVTRSKTRQKLPIVSNLIYLVALNVLEFSYKPILVNFQKK